MKYEEQGFIPKALLLFFLLEAVIPVFVAKLAFIRKTQDLPRPS